MIDLKALFISLGITTVFLVGLVLGLKSQSIRYEYEAIENNCAYYHPKTGEFTWKVGEKVNELSLIDLDKEWKRLENLKLKTMDNVEGDE
jgi:hypothetical protein